MGRTWRNLVGGLLAAMLGGAAWAEPFSFVALGDTAYNLPRDEPVYARLIARINAARPAFTVHVGDTWGALPCTEANYRRVLDAFQTYDHPLIYTPGDNEWTDCRKPAVLEAYARMQAGRATPADAALLGQARSLDNAFAGSSFDDPLGSLAIIRRTFFATPETLGGRPFPLVRQPGAVENARWAREGVVSPPSTCRGRASASP